MSALTVLFLHEQRLQFTRFDAYYLVVESVQHQLLIDVDIGTSDLELASCKLRLGWQRSCQSDSYIDI